MHTENKKDVVVLIMAYRSQLSELEKISLKQCFSVLGRYPISVVKPQSAVIDDWDLPQENVVIENFENKHFRDVGTYSRLLLKPAFYERFSQYKYILIYQLDAFVFRDELKYWCSLDYDYIGAPWFENFSHSNASAKFIRGGNGGFSLRKVSSHLRVLRSFSYINRPAENWKMRMESRPSGKGLLNEVAGFLLDLTVRNNTYWLLNSFKGFEDQFWCLVAARNFPWFIIPDSIEEMKFSFEMQPRRIFEMNDYRLPFGCHAWWKYDLPFWKPMISEQGHVITENESGSN